MCPQLSKDRAKPRSRNPTGKLRVQHLLQGGRSCDGAFSGWGQERDRCPFSCRSFTGHTHCHSPDPDPPGQGLLDDLLFTSNWLGSWQGWDHTHPRHSHPREAGTLFQTNHVRGLYGRSGSQLGPVPGSWPRNRLVGVSGLCRDAPEGVNVSVLAHTSTVSPYPPTRKPMAPGRCLTPQSQFGLRGQTCSHLKGS